jgi:hypothetical protein
MKRTTLAALAAAGIAAGFGSSVLAAGGARQPVVAGIVEGSYRAEGVDATPHLALVVFGSKLSKIKRVALGRPGLTAPFTASDFTTSDAVGPRSAASLVAEFLADVAPGTYDVYFDVPTSIGPTDVLTPSGRVVITNAATSGTPGQLGRPGTINTTTNPVDWSQIKNVPAGIADGADAVGPTYAQGAGVTIAGTTISLNFAGNGVAATASRSDHNHDATYVLKAGDTMTGPLTVTGAVTANGALAATNPSGNALVAKYSGASASTTSANNCAVFQSAAANVARIDNTGKGFFNGGTQTSGADFAESVEVKGAVADFEAGDVIVIDTTSTRRFTLSTSAESPLFAGVYATKPGVLARPGDVAGDQSWKAREIPMAMVGIVPCKACDEGGAIRVGDLLVTSSLRGRAMRAPKNPAPGTIIGKALGTMDAATGAVEVLLLAR